MKTIDAMKQALNVCIEMSRFGDAEAVSNADSVNVLLREAIAAEEAQTVEPIGLIYQIKLHVDSESTWRDATHEAYDLTLEKSRRGVYNAVPAPSGERAELVAELRSACIDGTLHAALVTKAADMLAADAQRIEYLEVYSESQTDSFDMMMLELKKLRAQQVAVQFRCSQCKLPVPSGYACSSCGSDEAEEDLCDDEGCPHNGTVHVCTNSKENGKAMPQGWKLVPTVSGPGMYVAGGQALMQRIKEIQATGRKIDSSDEALARCAYSAMLAAAPQPPQADAQRVPMTEGEIDAPQQEPVMWMWAQPGEDGNSGETTDKKELAQLKADYPDIFITPLYTKPQPVAELTDQQIAEAYYEGTCQSLREKDKTLVFAFARAVLAAQKAKK